MKPQQLLLTQFDLHHRLFNTVLEGFSDEETQQRLHNSKDINHVDPAAIGMPPGIPAEVPHTITFKDLGDGKTEITIVEEGYTSQGAVEMSKMGMSQCLDKMERILMKS